MVDPSTLSRDEWYDYCHGYGPLYRPEWCSGGPTIPAGYDSAEERREREARGYCGGQGDPHHDTAAAIRRL